MCEVTRLEEVKDGAWKEVGIVEKGYLSRWDDGDSRMDGRGLNRLERGSE